MIFACKVCPVHEKTVSILEEQLSRLDEKVKLLLQINTSLADGRAHSQVFRPPEVRQRKPESPIDLLIEKTPTPAELESYFQMKPTTHAEVEEALRDPRN